MYVDNNTDRHCFHFVDETILLDLKHLLMEAKQFVPDFLQVLESDVTQFEDHGGKFWRVMFYMYKFFE